MSASKKISKHNYDNYKASFITHNNRERSTNYDDSIKAMGRKSRTQKQREMKQSQRTKSSSSILSHGERLQPRGKLQGKSYWQDVIDEVEFAVHCHMEGPLPMADYSVVLPPRLRKRVNQIQSYDYSKSDEVAFVRDEMRDEQVVDYQNENEEEPTTEDKDVKKLKNEANMGDESFSESQQSDIVRMDQEFQKYDLRLDEPAGHTHRTVDKTSWFAKFLCASREERVSWNTRVERSKRGEASYTLDEQQENLMDASAERFINWLNTIGTVDTVLTPDKVKELFSIKGDRTLQASVKIDPKEVNAIAQTIANKWRRPDMAIELRYEKHINDYEKQVRKKPLISAFGRTVPEKDRQFAKGTDHTAIETVFSKELLTRERIFNGITHLRSTSALINFYVKNPKLPRPEYLVQGGYFKETSAVEAVTEVPLYEYLGLRY